MTTEEGQGEEEPALLGAASARVLMATFSAAHAPLLIPDCTFLCVSNRTSVQGGGPHSTHLGPE